MFGLWQRRLVSLEIKMCWICATGCGFEDREESFNFDLDVFERKRQRNNENSNDRQRYNAVLFGNTGRKITANGNNPNNG